MRSRRTMTELTRWQCRRTTIGLGLAIVSSMFVAARATAQSTRGLDQNCTVSILNRSARVHPDGSWQINNIPAIGRARVRAVCRFSDGTMGGHSGFVDLQPFQYNGFDGNIELSDSEPIADGMSIAAPTTVLTEIGQTMQLSVAANLPDGGTRDVTGSAAGTNYSSSNAKVATVSADGLVTAVMSGLSMISASNEGALAIIRVFVTLGGDSDGDGIPDELEVALGMNPDNPADALEDFDFDGLNNAEEVALGTDIENEDTDSDGLADGAEVALGTDPLDADSDDDGLIDGLESNPGSDDDGDGAINALDPDRDNDGLSDGVEQTIAGNPNSAAPDGDADNDGLTNIDEVARGTNPVDRDTDDDGLWDGTEVGGGCDPLVFDAPTIVVGRVVDEDGVALPDVPLAGYALRMSNQVASRSRTDGTFELPGMTVCGGAQVRGLSFRDGVDLEGASAPVPIVTGGLTDVGDLVLHEQAGDLFGLPRFPTAGGTGTSFPLGHLLEGDFNGDGVDDLVAWTINANSGPAIDVFTLFLGRFDRTYGAAHVTRMVARTKTFSNNRGDLDDVDWASGDFDEDGNLDLVFAWAFESKATVLPGRGDGTFTSPISVQGVRNAQAIAVADIDEDEHLDLVIADGGNETIEIYRGDGHATFVLAASLAGINDPRDLVVSDFDGDGHADLATANNDTDDVSVFLGDGAGAFTGPTRLPVGSEPRVIAVADADGDTIDDLTVLNVGSTDVSLLAGNGNGTFDAEVRITPDVNLDSNDELSHLVVGELTGDAIPDILVVGVIYAFPNFPNGGALLRGTGGGGFSTELPQLAVTIPLRETVLRDLDGDGLLDLVDIANGTVLTEINLGDGAFLARSVFGPSDAIVPAFASGDFDGDQIEDLAYVNIRAFPQIDVVRHDPNLAGSVLVSPAISTQLPITLLAAADFDGDQIVDLALASQATSTSTIYMARGVGDTTFDAPVQVAQLSARISELVAVDYDDDGAVDLTGGTTQGFYRVRNTGSGTFEAPSTVVAPGLLGETAVWSAVGDLDADGLADIALGQQSRKRISVWTSGGNASLTESVIEVPFSGGGQRRAVIADFDGDGLEDLAVSNMVVSENGDGGGFFDAFAVYPGLGDGTFADPIVTPLTPEGRFFSATDELAHADLDGDGNEDLVWMDNGSFVRVLLGNGNGTFNGERRYELGQSLGDTLHVVDIDGNTKPDVAVSMNLGGPALCFGR